MQGYLAYISLNPFFILKETETKRGADNELKHNVKQHNPQGKVSKLRKNK